MKIFRRLSKREHVQQTDMRTDQWLNFSSVKRSVGIHSSGHDTGVVDQYIRKYDVIRPKPVNGACRNGYVGWLNSLASDLDLMLNDICRGSFPYSSPIQPQITAPQQHNRARQCLGEDPILEQYMSSAAALVDEDDDDDEYASSSVEAFSDHSSSDVSSDGEFFSVDEESHQSSDGAVVGSDGQSFYTAQTAGSPRGTAPFLPHGAAPPGDREGAHPVPVHPLGAVPSINSVSPLHTSSTLVVLKDRVRWTHPLWYLPNILRKEACQLLFDKEQGTFLVRQASEPGRMVLSIRTGHKPSIEHFLVENAGTGLKLKGCFRSFEDVSRLITHYCQSQDGLPVQLVLPHIIMQAKTQHELTSLALLGQDFWTSSISRPPPIVRTVFHTTVSSYNSHTRQKSGLNNSNSHERQTCKRRNSSKRGFRSKASNVSSFDNVKAEKSFTVSSQRSNARVGHQSSNICNGANAILNGSEPHGVSLHKEYSLSSLTNHCRERSAFHTPPIYGEASKVNGYNNTDLLDKLSDYEDAQGPFFQPINNLPSDTSSNIGGKVSQISSHYENVKYNGLPNPGYASDCLSEKSDYIDANFFINLDVEPTKTRKRLISTEHVEETTTVCLDQLVPKGLRQTTPVMFTFNVVPSTPTQPTTLSPTVSGTFSVPTSPHKVHGVSTSSSQFSTPSYMEPADTLIGRVAGASHTNPVVKVNNTLRQEGGACYTNSMEIKPSTSRAGSCHNSKMMENKPPPGPHRVEIHHDIKPSMMLKYGKHDRVLTRSPQNSVLHQRRRDTTPLISHLEVVKKMPPKVFIRSQSLRSLPTSGDQNRDWRAQSLPRDSTNSKVKGQNRGSLQTVLEPGSQSANSSPVHRSNRAMSHQHMTNGYASGCNTTPVRTRSETQAINNHLNEILGDLDELNLLIDDPLPPPLPLAATLRRFPKAHSQSSLNSTQTSFSDTCTVDDVLNNISPELTLRPIKPLTAKNLQRRSDYDNLNNIWCPSSRRTIASSIGTHYSQPWDSNILQDLITFGSVAQQGKFPTPTGNDQRDSFVSQQSALSEYSLCNESESGRAPSELSFEVSPDGANPPANQESAVLVQLSDDEGMEDDHNVGAVPLQGAMEPVIAPLNTPGVGNKPRGSLPGIKVRDYVSNLAQNRQTTFGKTVDNFISCTKEGTESKPHVVIRNVRQFMNGIKNYLVQNGEEELNEIIEEERKQLDHNEFLNLDALIEGALHKCVVKPLERHILSLFVEDYKDNGSLRNMKENIEYARTKTPYELGIKPGLLPPEGRALEKIKHSLHKMQKAYSPIIKLQHLLGATSAIYNLIQEMEDNETASSTNSTVSLGADDFLPMFIYVLVQCGMVSAEIEVDYMWGLLHPYILAGEGGYHLTTLSSAVHVLKNLKITMESTNDCPRLPSLGDLQGFMKIIIPDEKNHSIITKILPVRPNMTTKDVVNMIAHRFKFTNPQDYGLYILISGVTTEDHLQDIDCPQTIKESVLRDGRECVFAYKRNNAKFVWPIIFKS